MTPAQLAARKKKGRIILKKLKKLVPDSGMMLNYSNNWELMVAVILSAQCTDNQVNKVTATLFKKYPTLNHYIRAKPSKFERDIFSTGFYRSKTRNILASARLLRDKFNGSVPRTMEDMLTFPGVSRKTANVVLGNAYGVVEGIAVDTHVARLAQRLGLTSEKDPAKIERDLMAIFPKKEWFRLTYLLIEYGRRFCPARRHDHASCPIR